MIVRYRILKGNPIPTHPDFKAYYRSFIGSPPVAQRNGLLPENEFVAKTVVRKELENDTLAG
jgi:hypothetical protein